ncbi:Uncharacterised protein [Moraxella caprae]|uniref:Uncharacterized protein n=1 Tax=Moraxella caprae TaxID=90240 RepID=A0A378QZQ8_9GAMM|nr:Uncharacterised protein [Moraxella caprae]
MLNFKKIHWLYGKVRTTHLLNEKSDWCVVRTYYNWYVLKLNDYNYFTTIKKRKE